MNKLQSEFRENGVVLVERALDHDTVRLAENAFNWSLNNPGPGARNVLAGKPGEFYQDHGNPRCFDAYRELLCDTNVPDLIAEILGCANLWLLYEQIWLKEGGNKQRTPWHQDLPYIPLEGDDLAVLWTNLDVVSRENSLEFVPGPTGARCLTPPRLRRTTHRPRCLRMECGHPFRILRQNAMTFPSSRGRCSQAMRLFFTPRSCTAVHQLARVNGEEHSPYDFSATVLFAPSVQMLDWPRSTGSNMTMAARIP